MNQHDEATVVLPYCQYHHEHKTMIGRNAGDIQDIWKAIEKMKTAVTVGSFSMILALIGVLGNFALTWYRDSNRQQNQPSQVIILSDRQLQQLRNLNP